MNRLLLSLSVLIFTISSCVKTEDYRSDFVMINDIVPDAILEIRYYSTYNFVGTRIDGYEEPVAICTRDAAEALKNANESFVRMGYRIKIYDAYRPQMAVDHFCRWAADPSDTLMRQVFYPEITKDVLIPQEYIMERSGHTRGSTIDLTLVETLTGCEVDMGSPFDCFGYVSHPSVQPGENVGIYEPLTEDQYKMRMLLKDVMEANGFAGIESEWWHFTLKDEPFPDTYFTFPNKTLR